MPSEYHVLHDDEDQEWKIKKPHTKQASDTADYKKEAKEKAKKLAKNNKPSEVIIHYKSADSRYPNLAPIQKTLSYA